MDIQIIPTETRYRRRRGSSFGRFLTQLIFFLASLIPMCIIAWRIDVLGLGGQQQAKVFVQQVQQPAPKVEVRRPPYLSRAEPKRPPVEPNREAVEPEWLRPIQPERKDAHEEIAKPLQNLIATTVAFDLKKRIIRVVSIPENTLPEDVLCNVEGSPELAVDPLTDFACGGKRDLLFRSGISEVVVGAEVSLVKRGNAIVLEIHPKYRLPSGDEDAFYKVAGMRKGNLLTKQVAAATNAQQALPGLRSQLSSVKSAYQSALQTANTPTTTSQGYLAQVAAQRRAAALARQGAALEKQITTGESLVAQLAQLRADLAAIEKLGQWGAKIAESATLSVTFHHGGNSLLAEVK